MHRSGRYFVVATVVLFTAILLIANERSGLAASGIAGVDVGKFYKMMADFDPNHPVIPQGDTVKVAVVASFSGPASLTGQLYFLAVQWAAHAINQQGGIRVDGKKKLIAVIKADHMARTDICRRVCERVILKQKVCALIGTDGSHLQKIINHTAAKYKIISVSIAAISDDLHDARNFNRYSFMSTVSAEQIGRGLAYYYGQIRKKEKRFYIICQDYSMGRSIAAGFKKGLREYFPEAQLVGEDYHKLFLTDYAAYLTKIKASGAEVIFTGDWMPDAGNLLKQARQMGVDQPFANVFMDEPNVLNEVGIDGTEGLVNITQYGSKNPAFKTEVDKQYNGLWHHLWETKWTSPYHTFLFQYPLGNIGSWIEQAFWFFSVMERAGSVDAEKIINVWEGDEFHFANGKKVTMRACDHKIVQNLHVYEYVRPERQKQCINIPPYYWFKNASGAGPSYEIPAAKVLPWMDPALERCKGKNGWGR